MNKKRKQGYASRERSHVVPTDYIIRDSNSFTELLAVVKLPNLFTAPEKKK
jgi:hypothetical protein